MKSDRERQISFDILLVESKKKDTNEVIYKTETDSQTLKTNLWLPKGKCGGEGQIRSWGLTYTHYYI